MRCRGAQTTALYGYGGGGAASRAGVLRLGFVMGCVAGAAGALPNHASRATEVAVQIRTTLSVNCESRKTKLNVRDYGDYKHVKKGN
jgi:hypothetical protein